MNSRRRERPLVLVTGSAGQLGHAFRRCAENPDAVSWIFADRAALDVSLESRVHAFIREHTPDAVVNCAAYTNVERAESEEEQAYLVNSLAPKFLADACAENHALLVHFSTDYVFDGASDRPYSEKDTTNPLSAYGRTKLEGERLIDNSCDRYLVIRTSWLYGLHGHNFYRTMIRLAQERGELRVVNDQRASPTYAGKLAQDIAVWLNSILVDTAHTDYGVYHYSHGGEVSWWEFAREIVALHGPAVPVHPVRSDEFPTKAVRPAYSKLDASRFHAATGILPVHWRDALAACIHDDQQETE
jgi:dTDP-4-dehydrorhamnose reductase